MELASFLKRMGLKDNEDCASVTLGAVQHFLAQPISPTGKKMLEGKFGIKAKPKTYADLELGKITQLVITFVNAYAMIVCPNIYDFILRNA